MWVYQPTRFVSRESLDNFFDLKTRTVKEFVDSVVEKIQRDLDAEGRK
jgi:hypothetical protein